MRIIGEIPARLGSVRVKQKNLRDLNGRPMISYAINAAKNSKKLTEFYVNTESDSIGDVAISHGARYFKRDSHLATDEAKQDDFNYDFIVKTKADYLVLINPVCPLINGNDIDAVIQFAIEKNYDTVVTVKEEKLHGFCNNEPINFDSKGALPRTQDIPPLQVCTWSVCVWKAQPFKESYEKNKFACFVGKVGFFPIHPKKSIKVSEEEDFKMAELLLKLEGL